jgi:hypothetical protein
MPHTFTHSTNHTPPLTRGFCHCRKRETDVICSFGRIPVHRMRKRSSSALSPQQTIMESYSMCARGAKSSLAAGRHFAAPTSEQCFFAKRVTWSVSLAICKSNRTRLVSQMFVAFLRLFADGCHCYHIRCPTNNAMPSFEKKNGNRCLRDSFRFNTSYIFRYLSFSGMCRLTSQHLPICFAFSVSVHHPRSSPNSHMSFFFAILSSVCEVIFKTIPNFVGFRFIVVLGKLRVSGTTIFNCEYRVVLMDTTHKSQDYCCPHKTRIARNTNSDKNGKPYLVHTQKCKSPHM